MGNSRRSALFPFGWTGRRVIAVHNRVSQGSEQYESGGLEVWRFGNCHGGWRFGNWHGGGIGSCPWRFFKLRLHAFLGNGITKSKSTTGTVEIHYRYSLTSLYGNYSTVSVPAGNPYQNVSRGINPRLWAQR